MSSSAIPETFFKFSNIIVGTSSVLSSLAQLTYIFTDFGKALLALYALVLSILIVHFEFKVPPQMYRFVSFYFSFLGRGLLYILLSIILFNGGPLKVINSIVLLILGLAHILFQFMPVVEEPSNYKAAGSSSSISIGDDNINDQIGDDDDDVI
ncbi:Tvp15p NDAI_0J01490 [Naumovozyma dairenensis CBS 421]|uniref:Golgi apparatus membrane protein TVP15 n=1 Tax=Naumovozyma dairenensis (strain ATCC 10597 / BCRC 20456 / CBS 421 / NBRC 0211 / NRRL Y-12639) TaxID=1071378 RepID=G0WGW3_NAUDC|nr:hypothetical protein NDAI_0J01490 [Naumovozyma dairenensis CBS 421]CCD27041.1 hypothetical protein NDAI_0J01490 [Naumovozyma dairenensis CBS 421]